MKLRKEDKVIGLHAIAKDSKSLLFTVSLKGYGKLTDLNTLRVIHRGGIGVKIHKLTSKIGSSLAGALIVKPWNQILIITNKGQNIRFSCEEVSKQSRHSQGIRLIRLKESEFVTGISVIDEIEKDPASDLRLNSKSEE